METLPFQDIVLLYYVDGEQNKPSDFLPYVAYLDAAGEPRAWFFDAYMYIGQGSTPAVADWARPLFAPGGNLDALHDAVKQVAERLGAPPAPRLIYFGMPLMSGTVEERIERNRRYIDMVRELWAAKKYDYLQLGGFYWTHEGIRDPQALETVTWTHNYLRSLTGTEPWERERLELLFIPYDVGHPNRPQVVAFGKGELPVDALWLQPNFLWAERERGYDRQDLDEVARFALGQEASIEMEYDSGVPVTGWKTARYYHYLDAGVTYGYMNGPLAFYQGLWGYAEAARNQLPVMRQVYEDTFAFVHGFYRPRSLVYELPLHTGEPAMAQLATRFANMGDALLGQGLWLGRRERPERVTHLRIVEPDPNQSYWLILTLAAPHASGDETEGVITLETRDGASVEIGRYALDGSVSTRWFPIPSELLRRGVPGNPSGARLTYTVRFSVPVQVEGGWLRSQQHVMAWDRVSAAAWEAVDPNAFAAREGRSLPGIRWDAATGTVRWFSLDGTRDYIAAAETDRRTVVWTIPAAAIASDGSGVMPVPGLEPEERVERLWVHPADEPFYLSLGVQGDTAAAARRPGIAVLPSDGWQFAGAAVGTGRRLAGQVSLQVDVPADGRAYTLRIKLAEAARLSWMLLNVDGTAVADGTVTGELVEISVHAPGTYELRLSGSATLHEAWLVPQRP